MSVVVCSLPPLLLTWALKMGDPFPPHLVWTPVMDLDGTRGQSSRFIAGSDPTEACSPPPTFPPRLGEQWRHHRPNSLLHLLRPFISSFVLLSSLIAAFQRRTASGTLTGCPESGLCLFTVNPNTGIVWLARPCVWLLLPSPLPLLRHH